MRRNFLTKSFAKYIFNITKKQEKLNKWDKSKELGKELKILDQFEFINLLFEDYYLTMVILSEYYKKIYEYFNQGYLKFIRPL